MKSKLVFEKGARGLPVKTRNNLPIWSEFNQLCMKYNSFNLCHGTPGIQPPEFLQESLFQAVREGNNQYTLMTGHPLLRDAVARNFKPNFNGRTIDPNTEVLITHGAS
jgi:methionine aminotransferase